MLGELNAQAFLIDVLGLASRALLRGQSVALVAKEARMLLARQVQRRSAEFDLLGEMPLIARRWQRR